jgi:hypothetical protein
MFSFFKPRPSDPRRDFLEAFLFYWFSENGFKCARVERNGIDFLAKNLQTGRLLGIAVRGAASSEQRVFVPREELEDARKACAGFDATPSFAFASSDAGETWLFVVRGDRLESMSVAGGDGVVWSLSEAARDGYLDDPMIMSVKVNYKAWRWWQKSP